MEFDIIIKNGTLITLEGGIKSGKDINLGIKENWDIGIRNGKIEVVAPGIKDSARKIISANGKIVTPGFIDPHTHLIFAGNRVDEFGMRLKGASYMEIREKGGGIKKTVQNTKNASSEELYQSAKQRIETMLKWGVTTVEIKSGYGLELGTEMKMLNVVKKLKEEGYNVIPTFLGAHDIPEGWKKDTYIEHILSVMMPEIAGKKLAAFCDVFCEKDVFNPNDAMRILQRGKAYGLIPKIHADEITSSGGAEVSGEVQAISAEHLIYPSDNGLKMMAENGVIAVLLPGTSFFLNESIPPIEKFRNHNIPIAIGSDFNPGSSPIISLPLIMGIAAIKYKLYPEEIIAGVTINAAYALNIQDKKGSIETGKDADLLILKYKDYREILYWLGENPVEKEMLGGRIK